MSNPLERRYRRVLRLLPVGYRRTWEEDMVTTFLQSSDQGRPRLVERLSVVGLAVRLRLNGSHATPRWAPLYRAGHAMALLVLLYQAVAATASTAFGIALVQQSLAVDYLAPWYQSVLLWSRFVGVLWVAAFGCFVLGRFVAARLVALLAVGAAVGLSVAIVVMDGPNPEPVGTGDVSRWGWLVVSAVVVFVTPPDAKASRRLWFGAYLAGSAVVVLADRRAFVPPDAGHWQWARFGDLSNLSAVALVVALSIALVRAWANRGGSPHWLLALAIVAGGLGGMRLVRELARPIPPFGGAAAYPWVSPTLDGTLVGLAALALVAGLLAWRRVPLAPAGG